MKFSDGYMVGHDAAIAAALDFYVGSWLQLTVDDIAVRARGLCKAINAGIMVTIQPLAFPGNNRAYLNIYQIGGEPPHDRIEQWAFDYTFTVPMGGYTPPNPPGYFVFTLTGGVKKHVKRAYSNKGGQTIHRKGYMSQAIRQVFIPSHMDAFSAVVARFTSLMVAKRIAGEVEAKGHNAVIV